MRTWGIVMLLSTACLALTVSMCVACGGAPTRPGPAFPDAAREAELADAQLARSLRVVSICANGNAGGGTAVLARGRRALTALHVLNCGPDLDGDGVADPSAFVAPAAIMTTDRAGNMHLAHLAALAADRDIAAIDLDSDPEVAPPPAELADAPHAGRVCFAPAIPERGRVCGEVRARYSRADLSIYHSAGTTFGNSGSGLYDGDGRLVGIVTRCDTPHCVAPTGGYASPVWPARWVLE